MEWRMVDILRNDIMALKVTMEIRNIVTIQNTVLVYANPKTRCFGHYLFYLDEFLNHIAISWFKVELETILKLPGHKLNIIITFWPIRGRVIILFTECYLQYFCNMPHHTSRNTSTWLKPNMYTAYGFLLWQLMVYKAYNINTDSLNNCLCWNFVIFVDIICHNRRVS